MEGAGELASKKSRRRFRLPTRKRKQVESSSNEPPEKKAEAACILKGKGFEASPLLNKFLDGDMLDPQSIVVRVLANSRPLPATKEHKEMLSDILNCIVEDVYSVLVDCLESKYLLQLQTKAAHDSGSHSNSGVLPCGSSLRQFAIKEFQKLLSDRWNPCLEDISYALVRGLVIERKCCLQFQFEAARVLTDKDFKRSPLLQKLLDGDMLDLRSIVAPVLPSNLQQPVTIEYEDVLYEKLSRIVEDVYSDFVELLVRKYLLKLQPGAACTAKESTLIFLHVPDPSQKIQTKLQEVDLFDLQSMVSLLKSADSNTQLLGIKLLGQLFSEGFFSEVKGILKSFVVVVVHLLANITWKMDSLEIQFEGAWTLIHIISHYSMKPLLVIKHDLVVLLLKLLETDSVCEKAMEELQKVSFYPVSRNYALQRGALLILLYKLNTTNVSILRKLTWTISKFCGGIIKPPFSQVIRAIKPLCELVNVNDDKVVLSNACRALCLISSTSDSSAGTSTTIWGVKEFEFNTVSQREINDAFHAADVLPVLVKLLNKYSSHSIISPAIHTVVNISTADDEKKIYIPEDEKELFLHCMLSLLDKRLEEKMVCVILAYMTGESTLWAEAVFAAGLIEPLRKLVEMKKMGIAAVAIANAIDGTVDDEKMESLVKCCIGLLCNYVVSDDKRWADAGLKGIEKILKLGEAKKPNCGGINVYAQKIKEDGKLENFRTPKLRLRARAIMMT